MCVLIMQSTLSPPKQHGGDGKEMGGTEGAEEEEGKHNLVTWRSGGWLKAITQIRVDVKDTSRVFQLFLFGWVINP